MSSTTVKFKNLPNSLPDQEFNGPPNAPQETKLLPMFVTGSTINHERYTYQTTTTRKWQWPMTLGSCTAEQKTTLEDLWSQHLLGSSNTFIYEHTDGEEFTARLVVEGDFVAIRKNNNEFDIPIVLEIDEQIGEPAPS
jgi:hypothetical protein